ncbi:hypothetical protein BIW11_09259 [Tropilaelaps mercedesae]|uniref:Nucleoporin NUP42 n=1 Tax=Tropilaelaps mercedesae TaxID=418985 RepID=A0A1V9XLB8_9ACAR|nr:hypothetical protein BIW11_09259 [Tropilaelaps mercedesae]
MTVCRYFLNGNCRYGQSCRYDHVYDGVSSRGGRHGSGNHYSNYHYSNNNHPQQQSINRGGGVLQEGSAFNFSQAALELSSHKTQETDQVRQELKHMLEGHFYPFTVVPGATQQMNFSHLSDLSPEEIRLRAYESLAANRFHEYQSEMAKHTSHVMQIIRQIIASPQLMQESRAKPGAGPVVPSIVTPSAPLPSQHQSNSANFPQPGIGGTQMKRITACMAQVSPAPFAEHAPLANNTQRQFSQHSSSGFAPGHTTQGPSTDTAAVQNSVPNIQPFSNPPVMPPASSKITDPPGPSNQQHNKDTTYSPMDALSEIDLAAFRDRMFTLDNLPLAAPPKELC